MKIAEELIRDKNRGIVTISSAASLTDAVALLAKENVGCLLVTDDDKIVGIWSERDLARSVCEDGFDIAEKHVGDYMHCPVKCCAAKDSVYSLIDKILGLRVRHLLVKKDDACIGLISVGDVLKACIRMKDHELAEANAEKGWDYYEEWEYKPGRGGEIEHWGV